MEASVQRFLLLYIYIYSRIERYGPQPIPGGGRGWTHACWTSQAVAETETSILKKTNFKRENEKNWKTKKGQCAAMRVRSHGTTHSDIYTTFLVP